jgi:hypothetical protein
MKTNRRTFLNVILPGMILLPLVWLMAGCLYIPFFEHRLDSGPNVRALVGPVNSGRPIAPMHVTKDRVIQLLGQAPYVSDDGNALGYVATTGVSSWVYPLCFFAAEPADAKTYVVRLVFDKGGTLIRYDWETESEYIAPRLFFGGGYWGNANPAIDRLNQKGPVLKFRP